MTRPRTPYDTRSPTDGPDDGVAEFGGVVEAFSGGGLQGFDRRWRLQPDVMNDMSFKDHFSTQAADYAAHRPRYPEAMFDWLATLPERREAAWDCATGNGQAAVSLAGRFKRVIATDASQRQIKNAEPHPNVEYRLEPAERSALPDGSIDLVAVAQAYHWFDHDRFCAEAKRVLRPSGAVVVWSYGLTEITPEVDAVMARLYSDIVGSYWPPERRHVEDRYASLPFPFREVDAPEFEMTAEWDLADTLGYFRTWSSTQRYINAHGSDPLELVREDFVKAWGDPGTQRVVRWPLFFRVGRSK